MAPRRGLELAALLAAHLARVKVAPTRQMTLEVLERLALANAVELPWPALRWEAAPSALIAPIEGLEWKLSADADSPAELLGRMVARLRALPWDAPLLTVRLAIWNELVLAEAESYFAYQLSKHRFDPDWARDLVYIQRERGVALSAAQWRYCAWLAPRLGASFAAQQPTAEAQQIRETMYADLRRRVSGVAAAQWPHAAYVPRSPEPESALGRLFAYEMTHLGARYWSAVPSEAELLAAEKTFSNGL